MEEDFWSIVASDEYMEKFHGQKPIYEMNGRDYYRTENLRKLIIERQRMLIKENVPKHIWFLTNSISGLNSLMRQAEWIEAKLSCH